MAIDLSAVDPVTLINASISVVLIIIQMLIGAIMVFRYVEHKSKPLAFLGMTWMGLATSWLGSVVTVFMVVFDPTSSGLTAAEYLVMSTVVVPIFNPTYVIGMTYLVAEKYKKPLIGFTIAYAAFYEIIMFTLIFTGNIGLMIVKSSPATVEIQPLTLGLLIYFMMDFVILGFLFCAKCFKSENREIRLKGKILLLSYIIYIVGNFIEQLPLPAIQRIMLIIAAIGFYMGYMLPNWTKKLFLKDYQAKN